MRIIVNKMELKVVCLRAINKKGFLFLTKRVYNDNKSINKIGVLCPF